MIMMTLMFAVAMVTSSAAVTQTANENLQQLQRLRAQIAQAEAAGVDGAMLSNLTKMANDLEKVIRADAATEADSSTSAQSVAPANEATYEEKPNALIGHAACSGFDESNYRQKGLAGGPDAQLDTMCAQAFEYHVMYKRARQQGYSEADANRTYDAHQKSAKVAINFYETTAGR